MYDESRGVEILVFLLSFIMLESGVAFGTEGVWPNFFVALVPLFFLVNKTKGRLLAVTPLLRIVEGAVFGGLLLVVASFVGGLGG